MTSVEKANPQAAVEKQGVARHLLMHPLTTAERHPEEFRLIRKHESDLDRWFTQMLGYRLHVDTDTARLFKTTYAPLGRPLHTATQPTRPLRQIEYTMLNLIFAATASGPSVISLRDLIAEMRSAAAEAEIELEGDTSERRATVTALKWMLRHGLVSEMHNHVDAYSTDEDADAILKMRPDRIVLLPVPALSGSETIEQLFESIEQRNSLRQRLRARLVEDPVLYRSDCTDEEWIELRRRLGEETARLDEMFALELEARSEGVAAIDPDGSLSSNKFPTGGTIGHAALLLIDELTLLSTDDRDQWIAVTDVEAIVTELATSNSKRWRSELVDSPERLTREVLDYLTMMMLCERSVIDTTDFVRLRPAAARYTLEPEPVTEPDPTLW